jgi:hypothetical protein
MSENPNNEKNPPAWWSQVMEKAVPWQDSCTEMSKQEFEDEIKSDIQVLEHGERICAVSGKVARTYDHFHLTHEDAAGVRHFYRVNNPLTHAEFDALRDTADPVGVEWRAGEGRKIQKELDEFNRAVEDAKKGFGQWDSCDPVVWAILTLVKAQTGLAQAIDHHVNYADDIDEAKEGVERAIAARIKAVENLRKAIEEEPRGFQ